MQLLRLPPDTGLIGFQLVQRRLIFCGVVVDLLDQLVGFLPLGAELLFLRFKLRLDADQIRLTGFQPGFLLLDLRLKSLKILNHLPVIVHDLVYDIQTAQQVGKAGGLEQHRPVAHRPLLLHLPHPLAEQLILGFLPLLGVRQFRFRLRNQGVVVGDLGFRVADLGGGIGDLVIQQALFLDGRRLIVLQIAELALDLFLLLIQIGGIVLQCVDIRLRDLGGHSRGGISRQQQDGAQQRRATPQEALMFLHSAPPLYLKEPPDGGKAAAYADQDACPQKYAAHRLPQLPERHDGKQL